MPSQELINRISEIRRRMANNAKMLRNPRKNTAVLKASPHVAKRIERAKSTAPIANEVETGPMKLKYSAPREVGNMLESRRRRGNYGKNAIAESHVASLMNLMESGQISMLLRKITRRRKGKK